MYNHAPENYECPFCLVVNGGSNPPPWTCQQEVVYRDEFVTAFISAAWWPNNPGHVIIVPNAHYENIYDLPLEIATRIHRAAREIAIAFKMVYGCDGTSTRQHNEPAGYQEVWHYHLHVFPRYTGDNLYKTDRHIAAIEERVAYAEKLRAYFDS
jgi:histidine triad (HIT) family protein